MHRDDRWLPGAGHAGPADSGIPVPGPERDELFETLTLVQTKKIEPMPIILVGERFWRRLVDFEFLVEEGMISRDDHELFSIVDSANEAVTVLQAFYKGVPPAQDK